MIILVIVAKGVGFPDEICVRKWQGGSRLPAVKVELDEKVDIYYIP